MRLLLGHISEQEGGWVGYIGKHFVTILDLS